MTTARSDRPSATGERSHPDGSCDSSGHAHFSASYEPLVDANASVVDAEDLAPNTGPLETDVWLTEWQVAEDGFDVAVGQRIHWTLVPMDQVWAARLCAGRRTVLLARDTYADATWDRGEALDWTALSGHVVRIDQISVRYQPSENPAQRGRVPEAGSAMHHSVQSLQKPRSHHGQIVGWIVRIHG
jgi:hypothetical protein